MSEELTDRLTELLEEAERVDAVPSLEAASEDDVYDALGEADGILESAEDARALISTTDSRDLLEALGLAELPDGGEAETIPEAIAAGDTERLVDLHVLLKLARVADADHDGEDLEGALEALREGVERRDEEGSDRTDDDSEERSDDDGDRDDESETHDDRERALDDGDERPDGDEDGAADAESTEGVDADAGLEEELRSTMSDALEGFGDDVRDVRDRLEAVTVDDDAESTGESEDEGTEEDDAEDDSMLDDVFDSEDAPSRNPTTYSTMAPRPSDRADMRVSTRYSTMPDR